jgi:hypothetical protein
LAATDAEHDLQLILIDRSIGGSVLFGQVGMSVSVGDIVQCSVSLTFNEIAGTV